MNPTVPQELKHCELILLRKDKVKKPAHKWKDHTGGWRYSPEDARVKKHLKEGGGYAVYCKGVAVIDLDTHKVSEETRIITEKALKRLPNTFQVRTGGGGLHLYFNTDLDRKIVLHYQGEHIGEIQSGGKAYVVGPNSPHESGNYYEVENRSPLAYLSADDIRQWLRESGFTGSWKEGLSKDEVKRYFSRTIDSQTIPVEDFLLPDNAEKRGNEIQGSHPIHGSITGRNLAVNPTDNVWYCFRCEAGGGPIEAYAVASGYLDCSEVGPGCIDKELYKRILRELEEKGYDVKKLRPERREGKEAFINRFGFTVREELPDKIDGDGGRGSKVSIILHQPRGGNTYYLISQLVKHGGGNYFSHRHEVINHAHNILAEQMDEHERSIHLEGKKRVCNGDGYCNSCEKKPQDIRDINSYERMAEYMLDKFQCLKKDKIRAELEATHNTNFCIYHIMKHCIDKVDYILAPSYYFYSEQPEIPPKEVTALDEDPTVDGFYLNSVALAEFTFTKTSTVVNNNLQSDIADLDHIANVIGDKERVPKHDKEILAIIDKLKEINEVIEDLRSYPLKKDTIIEKLSAIEFPEVKNEDGTEVLEKVREYEMPLSRDDSLTKYFEPMVHPFEKRFAWSGDNPSTLHLIPQRLLKTESPEFNKLLIVGKTRALLFAEDLISNGVVDRNQVVVYKTKPSPFIKNFQFGVVEAEKRNVEDIVILEFIKSINKAESYTRTPSLVLCSSKNQQQYLKKQIGEVGHQSMEGGELSQRWNYCGGFTNIFYQNSVISRGVDVDQYDLLTVYSCNFAQPYWEARFQLAKEKEDDEDKEYARTVLNEIIKDETTNSVLRISPVKGRRENQVKIVIIGSRDFEKLSNDIYNKVSYTKIFGDVKAQELGNKISSVIKDVSVCDGGNENLSSLGYTVYSTSRRYNEERTPPKSGSLEEEKAQLEELFLLAGSENKSDDVLRTEVRKHLDKWLKTYKDNCAPLKSAVNHIFKQLGKKYRKKKIEEILNELHKRRVIAIDEDNYVYLPVQLHNIRGINLDSSSLQESSGSHDSVRKIVSDWLKLLKDSSKLHKFITEGAT